ncbi:MAG: class I SAM-dependent methyltransferase, partial [Chloroflexota bacterium]
TAWCRPTRRPDVTTGYSLLDVGGGARLERFGTRTTDRPHPGALGSRVDATAWATADLRFDRDRGWSGELAGTPWPIEVAGLTLELRTTEAGQVGLFPEHEAMLPWLRDRVVARVGEAANAGGTAPSVLHLFAYTGLATLAMADAGAAVAHVDASRPTVAWARRNADLSGAADRQIRWIVDDAVAFAEREVRRGRRYAGVVLDPPSYGHGPGRGAWRIEEDLGSLLATAGRLLEPDGFVLLTAHTVGFEDDRLAADLGRALGRTGAAVETGPLGLTTPDGRRLELGAFARSTGGA